ncbi:unnamed protein product, partial [Vitis vinifera]
MGNHLLMQLLTFRNYSSPNFSIISPSQPFNSLCLSVTKTREENGSHLHRHSLGHHLAPPWCLPQVWMPGGVLDLFGADFFRLPSWNCLCCLCHHQVIIHSLVVGECGGPMELA